MKTNYYLIITLSVSLVLCAGCKKDWLNKKPDISMVVPSTLADLQALLDNTLQAFNAGNCIFGEIGSDDYYLTAKSYSTISTNMRNAYVWAKEIYTVRTTTDWLRPYTQVYYSNVVLEALKNMSSDKVSVEEFNSIRGSALFYRSFAYYDMAQIFCAPFDAQNPSLLGLPLKLSSNLNINPPRSTLGETYNLIIEDLKNAIKLLPRTQKYKTRPTKAAAYGLLARTYLSMRDYGNAYLYSDSCLLLHSTLLTYSNLNANSPTPLPKFNEEVIFFNTASDATFNTSNAIVDSLLYQSYNSNDLRRTIFFKKDAAGLPRLFGRYSASTIAIFDGLAVDEMYIIRAESNARLGNFKNAIDDLNILLNTRWKPGSFTPYVATNADEALTIILNERRKELCFRGLRWSDLRRLNKDSKLAISLKRSLNEQTYTLPPNDNRYVYPLPQLETDYNNLIQNPR